jgi:hypothetical protein
MNESQTFQQVIDTQNKSILLQFEHWCRFELFSFQFWLLLAMLIIPWIIWVRLADKKRLAEIFIYGLLVMTVVTFLDEFGCQLNLWEYYIDIEPYFPRLIPMNFSMLPVWYMLVYQYACRWKSFLLANFFSAAFFTFVGEPMLVALKIYVLFTWKHIYSFPIYIIIAVLLKALTMLVMKKYRKAQE